MAKLTDTQTVPRYQHVELGTSRVIKDNEDLKIMIDCILNPGTRLASKALICISFQIGVVAR